MRISRMPDGQPEIFASIQGEGVTCGTPSVFVRLGLCNLRCSWCFVPETPVLMADWTWKPLEHVAIGDAVMAVNRQRRGGHLHLTSATVTNVLVRDAATVWVNEALRCTPDHRFWVGGRNAEGSLTHSGWRRIDRALWDQALFTTDPTRFQTEDYERGWLAGMADGDGCFWTLRHRRGYRRFRLALKESVLIERAHQFAARAGISLRKGVHSHRSSFGSGSMPCLWLTVDREAKEFEEWLRRDGETLSWNAGYLGGILDAEGSHGGRNLRIAQAPCHEQTRARIARVLDRLQLRFTIEEQGFYIHRGEGAASRALALARPAKPSLLNSSLGHHPHARRTITSVDDSGMVEPVIDLTTTEGSFVAGGYVVKNCDTPYTWDWRRYDPTAELMRLDVDEVARRVIETAGEGVRTVVLTGGEPLLQSRDLAQLAAELRRHGFRIEVETNGTITPPSALAGVVDQWNVSPKLASSGNARARREVPAALAWFARAETAWWKFVVTDAADLPVIEDLVARYRVPRERVILMPEGVDAETVAARSLWLADACRETGFRLGPRLHVTLWGSARGR